MAKRPSRAAPARPHEATVEPLFGATWRPPAIAGEPDREQSYVRKVRPHGENQRALMAALGQYSLTLALGPAGTGKT
jgi:phosphate starvation-inducible protein PhoH and related proteins